MQIQKRRHATVGTGIQARRRWPGAALALLPLSLQCGIAVADVSQDDGASMSRAQALIGDGACDDDSQCRTIAVGTKACGGPEYYLAWSTKRTEAAALQAAVDEVTAAQRAAITRRGLRSDCRFVADPGAYCTAGDAGATATGARVCRLRATANGGRSGRVD